MKAIDNCVGKLKKINLDFEFLDFLEPKFSKINFDCKQPKYQFQLLSICKMQKNWDERRTCHVKGRYRRNEKEINTCETNKDKIKPTPLNKIPKSSEAIIGNEVRYLKLKLCTKIKL